MDIKNKTLKAVFFDLDDTLCNYTDASNLGRKDALTYLQSQNLPNISLDSLFEAYWEAFHAMLKDVRKGGHWRQAYLISGKSTRDETFRLTLLAFGIDDSKLSEKLSEIYNQARRKYLCLYEDAVRCLDTMKGKYKLGLITNGPADVQRDEIATLGIADYFDVILIEGEFGEGKPSVNIFNSALSLAGVSSDEMLFIGDSYPHDIVGANSVGIDTYWINRFGNPTPEDQVGEEIVNLDELMTALSEKVK